MGAQNTGGTHRSVWLSGARCREGKGSLAGSHLQIPVCFAMATGTFSLRDFWGPGATTPSSSSQSPRHSPWQSPHLPHPGPSLGPSIPGRQPQPPLCSSPAPHIQARGGGNWVKALPLTAPPPQVTQHPRPEEGEASWTWGRSPGVGCERLMLGGLCTEVSAH